MEWLSAALIITAGMWLWITSGFFFFIILAFAENEKNFFAFLSLVIFVGLMQHSGFISIFADPVSLLGWVVIYFIAGGVWSILKWYLFIHDRANDFREIKTSFIERIRHSDDNTIKLDVNSKIPENLMGKFKEELVTSYFSYNTPYNFEHDPINVSIIPIARNYKEKIVTWILWWPTSAFWTLLNDPLAKIANWIYNRFQGIYTKIANKAFAEFEV